MFENCVTERDLELRIWSKLKIYQRNFKMVTKLRDSNSSRGKSCSQFESVMSVLIINFGHYFRNMITIGSLFAVGYWKIVAYFLHLYVNSVVNRFSSDMCKLEACFTFSPGIISPIFTTPILSVLKMSASLMFSLVMYSSNLTFS